MIPGKGPVVPVPKVSNRTAQVPTSPPNRGSLLLSVSYLGRGVRMGVRGEGSAAKNEH